MHIMEFYPAFKKKGILTHTTTQMKLLDIMLREIRQMLKTVGFQFDEVPRTVKATVTESGMVDARGVSGFLRGGTLVFNGNRISVREDEKVLEMMLVMAAQ